MQINMVNLKKINHLENVDYPIVMINDFLNKKFSKSLAVEISKLENFDDLVMNGRNRINKGSINFKASLNKSKNLNKLYKTLNKFNFYKKLDKIIKKNPKYNNWTISQNISLFSKKNFGIQKGKKLTKNFHGKKNILNLDIDFSVSKKGYFREPHRDRNTRVINFLIYLSDLSKQAGGAFEVYNFKNLKKNRMSRFPPIHKVKKVLEFAPKLGQFIFFRSTPNSYHGVSKLKSEKKRIFIYGSFSLNKAVKWKLN